MCIRDRDKKVALDCLDMLQISHLATRPFQELSGGERQMVLVARALTQQSSVLIMDAVSYTHLDVYKRQAKSHATAFHFRLRGIKGLPRQCNICNASSRIFHLYGDVFSLDMTCLLYTSRCV